MLSTFTSDSPEKFAFLFCNDPVYSFAFALYQEMIDGHICLDLDKVKQVNIQEKTYTLDVELLNESCFVSFDKVNVAPFLFFDNKLYLYKYFNYESQIVDYLGHMTSLDSLYEQRVKQLNNLGDLSGLKDSFSDLSLDNKQFIDWQFIACLKAFVQPFSIITGGPGTGKTTTIAKLLTLMVKDNKNIQVALAAPTGKAAVRMKEALVSNPIYKEIEQYFTDLQAMTIHRLLGSIVDSHYFKHNAQNPLDYDLVIIDEASMVDIALMSKLIVSLKPSSQLILLGDQNQLSSVGAGSLLKDFCDNVPNLKKVSHAVMELLQGKLSKEQLEQLSCSNSGSILQDNITELQFSRRFSKDSNIGKLSEAILTNQMQFIENIDTQTTGKDTVIIDTQYCDSYVDQIVQSYKTYIKTKDIKQALQHLNNTRVLCATRESSSGVYAMNNLIENKLADLELLKLDKVFYENRPIMITKNSPELKVFNGDIGIIRNNKAYFDIGQEELLEIQPGLLSDYQTVFAMTIHKSQGSEFDNILVVLPVNSENKLLTKQLLYTGVTRAKKRVVIQGALSTIKQALNNEVNRVSGLTSRLSSL